MHHLQLYSNVKPMCFFSTSLPSLFHLPFPPLKRRVTWCKCKCKGQKGSRSEANWMRNLLANFQQTVTPHKLTSTEFATVPTVLSAHCRPNVTAHCQPDMMAHCQPNYGPISANVMVHCQPNDAPLSAKWWSIVSPIWRPIVSQMIRPNVSLLSA